MNKTKKPLIPRLRFPEFKNAGEWEEKRLGEAVDIKKGEPITEKNAEYGDIPVIGGGIEPTYYHNIFNRKANTITISASGANAGFVNFHTYPIFASDCSTIEENMNGELDIKYIYYYLKSIQSYINMLQTGGAQPHVYPKQLRKIKIFVPSILEEQQKIADFLSSLDEIITLENKKLEALKKYKKGLMQQLFPQDDEKIPRLRFPEFKNAGEWEVRAIEQLTTKIAQGGTPKTSIPEYWNGGIPWITPADMGDDALHHYTETTLRSVSQKGLENSSTELLPANSVIVSSRAPIGYVTINKVEMATNQGCKGIVTKISTYYEFLYFSLLKAKERLNNVGAGSSFKEISTSTLKVFRISVPSFPEQQKIADFLSSLDEIITLENKKLEVLKKYKKGLMQQLFPEVE